MNFKLFFIIFLIIGTAVIFAFARDQVQKPAIQDNEDPKETAQRSSSSLSPQKKTLGKVEVEVIPISITQGKDIVFGLSLNTHSVDLSYDYTQITTLADEDGNSYKPSSWTGSEGGHHLEGELIFRALPRNPKELTLILDGIDDTTENFVWKL